MGQAEKRLQVNVKIAIATAIWYNSPVRKLRKRKGVKTALSASAGLYMLANFVRKNLAQRGRILLKSVYDTFEYVMNHYDYADREEKNT